MLVIRPGVWIGNYIYALSNSRTRLLITAQAKPSHFVFIRVVPRLHLSFCVQRLLSSLAGDSFARNPWRQITWSVGKISVGLRQHSHFWLRTPRDT
jgi:hypothetical protein